jgi:very-short-patch-repair endonuclease
MDDVPFIGSEALALGRLTRYELRRYHRAILPDVYVDRRAEPSLRQRTVSAWLWTRRDGVVAGLAAAALHGAKWIDDDVPVELIWRNARTPPGVITRADTLLGGETCLLDGLPVTTPARTAFDLGRRGPLTGSVARLDALIRATDVPVAEIEALTAGHRHTRGLRQLEKALDLVDAGAESPKETWLRLLLIRHDFPRPRTQIPVPAPDGYTTYYLDMGWEAIKVAVEYDGDHHRTTRELFAYEIQRAEDIAAAGWHVVRVAARSHEADVIRRVERAWRLRTR